jgi:CYTH domain-containing protein
MGQDHTGGVIERTPGAGSYAQIEREQRWLLSGLPEGVAEPVEILDRYFRQSTLRLRRMQTGSSVAYKLGQKVRLDPDRPSPVHMTNMYLTEPEFEFIGQLEGAILLKVRWHWTVGNTTISVDQFGGSLSGLVLAERELSPEEAVSDPPPLAIADVTEDDRFSGGRLALMNASEAQDLLESVTRMTGPLANP